jgi:3-oxoacyl-[acyl-carrier-protein] synthase-1
VRLPHCIGNAVEQIQLGKQDIVFAGGGEELGWEMACEFDAMGALSTKYNETPDKASRTYDAHRDGFVIAAAAVWLWLKSWSTLWHVARTSMLKSWATVQRLTAPTWLRHPAKARCAA